VTDFRQVHPNGIILAMDQMSAYLHATLTRVWAPRGPTPIIRITPQRDMRHFYGALDVIGGREVVLSLPTLDGEHTFHFLNLVVSCFPGRAILILLDRAPWHKGKARRFIEDHPLRDLFCFPPGCPDLNPQEQVWKQTPDAVGHLHNYPHLSRLRQPFQSYLETTLFQFAWIGKSLPTFYVSEFI
jgi:hypothetical protein